MTHTPHELAEEFPEFSELMHKLKTEDGHFQKLSEEYHELNREIHRAETEVEPVSDEHMEELKTRRVRLKDVIFELLKAAG